MSCLFCRIVSGEIPAKKVHEDDDVVAFDDINPQAPMHVLVVPKQHVATLNDLGADHERLVGAMVRQRAPAPGPRRHPGPRLRPAVQPPAPAPAAGPIAAARGYDARGYRTVFNCNADAGQTVFHIHLHVLGGRVLAWPPG